MPSHAGHAGLRANLASSRAKRDLLAYAAAMVQGRRQKNLILILAREFASKLATPMFVVDAAGDLVFYNEPAEDVLGRSFGEAGEMSAEALPSLFSPEDLEGKPLPLEDCHSGSRSLRGSLRIGIYGSPGSTGESASSPSRPSRSSREETSSSARWPSSGSSRAATHRKGPHARADLGLSRIDRHTRPRDPPLRGQHLVRRASDT